MNKLKGFGTCLDGCEKWGTIMQLFPKSKNIFDFINFYYVKLLEAKNETKILHFIFSLLDSPHNPYLHLLQIFFLLKILHSLHSFLLLRLCRSALNKRILRSSFVIKEDIAKTVSIRIAVGIKLI